MESDSDPASFHQQSLPNHGSSVSKRVPCPRSGRKLSMPNGRRPSIVTSFLRVPKLALNGNLLSGATMMNGNNKVYPAAAGDQSSKSRSMNRADASLSASTGDLSTLKLDDTFNTRLRAFAGTSVNLAGECRPTLTSHYDHSGLGGSNLPNYPSDNDRFKELEGNCSEYGSSSEDSTKKSSFRGFGWVRGVLIRCILCIFGTTLFLRMSWIAGQAGLLYGLLIVVLSFIVVIITAISMSAIATNGEVKGGGCYYLISRSLGPEFGGSIGLILYVANIVNASMNCVGLGETLTDTLRDNYNIKIFTDPYKDWDTVIYALATCLILQAIIFIGTEFENHTQIALMITIIVALVSHFVGTLIPPTNSQKEKGIVGYNYHVLWDNLWPSNDFTFFPQLRDSTAQTFFSLFAVYFPAMTGIMAGANMSGDLKNPSHSIPRGTFWAIAITTLVYGWCMAVTAATTLRETAGTILPVWNASTKHYNAFSCTANESCAGGLANDYTIMQQQGAWSPLILVGVFATSLSSASGCLIGAPRIFQALCEDKLFPYIHSFARGSGKNNDPHRAYFLTCLIAMAVILIGNLNAIAKLITNFFLAAFAITNFACFDASAAKSPGFRPSFRYYNMWLSLFGSALCVVVMFLLSWHYSLATLLVFALLFRYIKHNKSHINWGSSTEANRYRKALLSLLKITRTEGHVKNYRPQLLVLTGNPAARQALIDFANCICNGQNLMLCGHIIPHRSSVSATALIRKLNNYFTDWLFEQRIKAFYCAMAHVSLRAGVQCLLQTVGLGKMQPNILLIGYNNKWLTQCIKDRSQYGEYVGVLVDAFESNMSVCVFRNENQGLDHSALLGEEDRLFVRLPDLLLSDRDSSLNDDLNRGVAPKMTRPKATQRQLTAEMVRSKSDLHLPHLLSGRNFSENLQSGSSTKGRNSGGRRTRWLKESRKSKRHNGQPNNKFRTTVRDGVVDVWWLSEDGGLTLLLSHLLTTQNTYLPRAKMRVFTICSKSDPDLVRVSIVRMLKKFRISAIGVYVLLEEEHRELYPETLEEYEELMTALNPIGVEPAINKEMLAATHERTMRYLRHRELLLEYSLASSVIIITLPSATPAVVQSAVYMMWLELLSKDMPPVLFVRGNQTSVITYYS